MTIVLILLAWGLVSIGAALCCGEFFDETMARKLGPPKGGRR